MNRQPGKFPKGFLTMAVPYIIPTDNQKEYHKTMQHVFRDTVCVLVSSATEIDG
jgi:hypothetical protein